MHTKKHETKNTPRSESQLSKSDSNQKLIDAYDYLTNAASCQDCTGLIPSAPSSSSELEAYEELYHYLPPCANASTIEETSDKDTSSSHPQDCQQ